MAEELGFGAEEAGDVALAVTEAATNAIVHGYRGGEGVIDVSADRVEDELHVAITDYGQGMGPRLDSPGLGLGLSIIGRLAHRVDVVSEGDGTTIEMVWSCPAT